MRFSLQDVKKTVSRRGKSLTLALSFLQSDEYQMEITSLIAYHERLLGSPQRLFSFDDARALIGDYRLANCLLATLSHWYSWRQRPWAEAVAHKGNEELYRVASASALRLALYDFVNEHFHGYVGTQARTEILQTFAQSFDVTATDIEYLLSLDTEGEAILTRISEVPPTVSEVALLYNQWAFEAAISNSSQIHFLVDCTAFSQYILTDRSVDSVVADMVISNNAGPGQVIKHICFLARRMGVYYELSYDQEVSSQRLLSLTLYGPQDVTGVPQQYGIRLARFCRALLGYGAANTLLSKRGSAGQLTRIVRQAEATVHFLQRTYTFHMSEQLLNLRLLPPVEPTQTVNNELFDSSIEQNFAEAFQALARRQGTDGWQLEREPEPLLFSHGIIIPDFALVRGNQRLYLEILGFWTPSYRERKIEKLRHLRGRNDLLLALPQEAQAAFAELAQDFPLLIYKNQLAVADVLHLLRRVYDNFEERLTLIDHTAIIQRLQTQGLIPETECFKLLCCYRQAELQQAVAFLSISIQDLLFITGIGLCTRLWLEQLQQPFEDWLLKQGKVSLRDAAQQLIRQVPLLQSCSDTALENLLSHWSQVEIEHQSLFSATVALRGYTTTTSAITQAEITVPPRQSKKRRLTAKRTAQSDLPAQEHLW